MMATGLAAVGIAALLKVAWATSSSVKPRPSRGAHTGDREEVGGDLRRDHDLGVAIGAECAAHRVVAGDAGEGRGALPPVVHVAAGGAGAIDAGLRVGVDDADQPLGLGVGKGPQHHGVDQREEHGADADADGHRDGAEHRERRRAAEHAGGVTGLAQHLLEHEPGALLGDPFAGDLHAAGLEPGLSPRLVLAQAGLAVARDHLVDVNGELLGGVAFDAAPLHDFRDTPSPAMHRLTPPAARGARPRCCAARPSARWPDGVVRRR